MFSRTQQILYTANDCVFSNVTPLLWSYSLKKYLMHAIQ